MTITSNLFAIMLLVSPALAQKGKPKPPSAPPINPAIVYTTGPTYGNNLIAVANADGTNQTIVLDNGVMNYDPSWSPDGNYIIFASQSLNPEPGIYRLQIDRTTAKAIGAPVFITPVVNPYYASPRWSPEPTADGRYMIVYTNLPPGETEKYDIYLVEPVFNGAFYNVTNTSELNEWTARWSPDATRLAINRPIPTTPGIWEVEVLTVGITDCPLGQLFCEVWPRQSLAKGVIGSPLLGAGTFFQLAWGNTGLDLLAVHVGGLPEGGSDIWIIPVAEPESAWNLTNTNGVSPPNRNEILPAWSPDDTQIIYVAPKPLCNSQNFQGIMIANVNGSEFPDGCEEKNLIKDGRSPSWWRGP